MRALTSTSQQTADLAVAFNRVTERLATTPSAERPSRAASPAAITLPEPVGALRG